MTIRIWTDGDQAANSSSSKKRCRSTVAAAPIRSLMPNSASPPVLIKVRPAAFHDQERIDGKTCLHVHLRGADELGHERADGPQTELTARAPISATLPNSKTTVRSASTLPQTGHGQRIASCARRPEMPGQVRPTLEAGHRHRVSTTSGPGIKPNRAS